MQQQRQLIYLLMSTLEEIEEATKRKVTGLFFIKTKHARPIFKNHQYFDMKGSQKDPRATLSDKWSMFVNQPSGYGIDNTLKYLMRAQSPSDTNSFKALHLTFSKQKITKNESSHAKDPEAEETLRPSRQGHHHKSSNSRLMKTAPKKSKDRLQTEPLAAVEEEAKHQGMHQSLHKGMRLSTEPTLTYSKMTESSMYRMRALKRKSLHSKTDMLKIPAVNERFSETRRHEENRAPEHNIELTYVFGSESRSLTRNDLSTKVSINILPYVISCFLKCKINFHKSMTHQQYKRIRQYIMETRKTAASYFDVKDIVNLSSIDEIEEMLNGYGEGTIQWYETIRHFFLPSDEKILEYQFLKLLDEIKVMTVLKSNIELGTKTLCIFRVEDRRRISSLHELMEPGTYIFSDSKMGMEIYNSIIKKNAEIFSFKNRIKRWRSVAPLDESNVCTLEPPRTQSDKYTKSTNQTLNQTSIHIFEARSRIKTEVDTNRIQSDRYRKLYELSKQKQRQKGKNLAGKQLSYNSRVSSEHNSFIDRTKLNKSHDIFQ